MASTHVPVFMLLAALTAAGAAGGPPAPDGLAGTSWRFVELYGTAVQLPAAPSARQAVLVFNGRGRVFGTDGCTRVLGSYTLDRDRINMSGMAGTQMPCVRPQPSTARLQEALRATQRWQMDGGLLVFYGQGGRMLALLERLPARTL
jgi:heat shock protein HslJ